MGSIFCSSARRQKLEQRHAIVSAVLATLAEAGKPEAAKCETPDDYYAAFERHYARDDLSKFPKKRLGKGLKKLAENKRRDDFQKKLEKKNSSLERKLSVASTSTASTKSEASSTTLVDSSDDEKDEQRKMSEDEGAPLELSWTWSALGEAF